ncbi:MAG: type II toxin-antitoxin system PemK/MazF family toxin [Phaeodactylibacter sp.]|nr:type II toxin-antitoxin system PemK/MazF family toxin [Phaeodactylibacter sp.]
MEKGDIVLIPFPFTDLTGSKKRPALILLSGSLDVTVSFISTQLHWQEPTDLLLQPNSTNGLKKPSLVRIGKIATIDKALVIGKLGNIDTKEIEKLDNKLIQIFNIKLI